MIIGYAKVATTDQNLGIRHDDLKPAFDASVDPTNVTSLRPWWSVRNTVHGGQGMRLLAVYSRRQVPAIDSDSSLSPLPVPGRVAHSAAGLL
jgi:hypothetical protein